MSVKHVDGPQGILTHHLEELKMFAKLIGVRVSDIKSDNPTIEVVSEATHSLKAARSHEQKSKIPARRWENLVYGQRLMVEKLLEDVTSRRTKKFRGLLMQMYICRLHGLRDDESPELLFNLTRKGIGRIRSVVDQEVIDATDSFEETEDLRDARLKAFYHHRKHDQNHPGRGPAKLIRDDLVSSIVVSFARKLGVKVKAMVPDEDVDYLLDLRHGKPVTGTKPISSLPKSEITAAKKMAMETFQESAERTFQKGENEPVAVYCNRVLRWKLENLRDGEDIHHIIMAVRYGLGQMDYLSPYHAGKTLRNLQKHNRFA